MADSIEIDTETGLRRLRFGDDIDAELTLEELYELRALIAAHIMEQPALADRDLEQRLKATFATRDSDGGIRLLFRRVIRVEDHPAVGMVEVILDVAAAEDTTDALTTLLDR